MNDRRSLVEGLTGSGERSAEEEFVYAGKSKAHQTAQTGAPAPDMAAEVKQQTTGSVVRVPLTTRIRSDFAAGPQTRFATAATQRRQPEYAAGHS